jgi:thiamine phosphate synthase YjbQ (UPF0047 family)
MNIQTKTIDVSTKGNTDIHDITPEIRSLLHESGMTEGQVTVFVPGATAGIKAFQHWVDTKAGWKPALQNEVILCAVAQASCLQF